MACPNISNFASKIQNGNAKIYYYLACWDGAKVRDQSGQGVIPANTAIK